MVGFTALTSLANTVVAPYEVAVWRGFRTAAISYTFDDDLPNQYAVAVPMFNAKGFKITLFTVRDWVPGGSWAPLQAAALAGNEVASHTVSHPDLSTLSGADQTNQLGASQYAINVQVTNQLCVTLAYPYCNEGQERLTSRYYIAARGCSGQLVPATPPNFLNISSFVCGPQGSVQTAQDFNNMANNAAAANAWCVYLIHAIDGDNGYSPIASTTLQQSVNYLSTHTGTFWVETFGNVVRYIKERDAVVVTETTNVAGGFTLQVTNNLDLTIYNYPITLRRPVPAGWPAIAVFQNNQPLPTVLATNNSTNLIMFDVVPNRGDVTLSKTVLPPVLSQPARVDLNNFTFRMDGQTGVVFAISSSSNLVDWQPIQTNTLLNGTTNLTVAASNVSQFYRAQWIP